MAAYNAKSAEAHILMDEHCPFLINTHKLKSTIRLNADKSVSAFIMSDKQQEKQMEMEW